MRKFNQTNRFAQKVIGHCIYKEDDGDKFHGIVIHF
jgi:hypothetical protein